MLQQAFQAAQTPEFAKVFCFFSSEKKAFLAFLPCSGRCRRPGEIDAQPPLWLKSLQPARQA
jgi:hypothetical protein